MLMIIKLLIKNDFCRGCGYSSRVEHVPTICEALGSFSNTTKQIKKKSSKIKRALVLSRKFEAKLKVKIKK